MINDLINNKNIEVYLQPIVSIKEKRVFAYEALTRATDSYGEAISPFYLFEQAKKENVSCKLDNYVRELALVKFQKYYHENNKVLLFINFESSTIENEMADDFIPTIYKYNIATKNIVIEIKEDKIKNTHALKRFIDNYKKHGCIIAIDDFGTGYSSFDRLSFIQPDIVKVDRSIIYNIHNNFINSEILSAISNMCHQIGAIVLAEGVEHRDEILACIRKDIDIFQGFWFSKPKKEIHEREVIEINKSIYYIGTKYKTIVNEIICKKKILLEKAQKFKNDVINLLETHTIKSIQKVEEVIEQNPKLQAIYIIGEESALQIGPTIIHAEEKHLFKATKDGSDHSLREYYFIAKDSSRGDYLSTKYISRASGNMCRTYSAKITLDESHYIVCFDILD